MKLLAFLFSLLLVASCNNSVQTNNVATDTNKKEPAKEITHDLSGCYLRVLKRDTLALSIQQKGDSVTGKLSFNNYEKDGSTGTVNGSIENNTLKLFYNFQSEGMQSVMEVYFKIADDMLIHGVGEVAAKSDTTYYANPGQLTYPESNRLIKIDCGKLDSKYK